MGPEDGMNCKDNKGCEISKSRIRDEMPCLECFGNVTFFMSAQSITLLFKESGSYQRGRHVILKIIIVSSKNLCLII